MPPTIAQHLFAHRQMARVSPERQALALETSLAFSPPDVVAANAQVDGDSWAMHLARIWGKLWLIMYEPAPYSLHEAWRPWLPESVRHALRPCEWPLAAALGRGALVSPELLKWAVEAGSDGLWTHLAVLAGPRAVSVWSAMSLPDPSEGEISLIVAMLRGRRHSALRALDAMGLDVNGSLDDSGNTPLHQAHTADDVAVLLGLGADPLRRNGVGKMAAEHWQDLPGGLRRVEVAKMTAILRERTPVAVSEYASLFHTVIDHSASAPWGKVCDAGWHDAIGQNPPVVFQEKGLEWSLLAQVSRTMSKSMPAERRQDLLKHALHHKLPRSLLTHESIPGVPDVLFAMFQALCHPIRQNAALCLSAAQRRVYPTPVEWVRGFVAASIAWRQGPVQWSHDSFMTALAPREANHILAHPCPDWLSSSASTSAATRLAPLIQEAWMGADRQQNNRVAEQLAHLWDAQEGAGRTQDLAAWAPALLGKVFHDTFHAGSAPSHDRLERWLRAGVDFGPALEAAEVFVQEKTASVLVPRFSKDGSMWSRRSVLISR